MIDLSFGLYYDLFLSKKPKEILTDEKIHEVMEIVVEKMIENKKKFRGEYWEVYEFHTIVMKKFMEENPYAITGAKQLVNIKKIALHYANMIMYYFVDTS